MNLRIESATADDIPALSELLDSLFSIEQDFQPNTERQTKGLALLLQHPDRACIKVARSEGGLLIGMVSAQLVISTAEGAASAWVEDMVVRDGWRGQGAGRALLQSVLEWAGLCGATRAQLLVDIDNTAAVGYYDHLGWDSTRLAARRIFL